MFPNAPVTPPDVVDESDDDTTNECDCCCCTGACNIDYDEDYDEKVSD